MAEYHYGLIDFLLFTVSSTNKIKFHKSTWKLNMILLAMKMFSLPRRVCLSMSRGGIGYLEGSLY